jgi:molybdopterin synthase catalytic subunit
MTWTAIVDHPLDVSALIERVQSDGTGAISVFVGTVRNEHAGRAVTGIDYSAYRPMAEKELATIVLETEEKFAGLRVAVEHRLGTLAVRDASVVIVATDARRANVHAATMRVIEEMKKRVPIWKCEHYVDGTREWVHAGTSAPRPAEVSV